MFSFRHSRNQKEKQIIQIAYRPVQFHRIFCNFDSLLTFSSYEISCSEKRDKKHLITLFTYIETMTLQISVHSK